MFFLEIFQDAFFAALAGIGFASISNPPKQAYNTVLLSLAWGMQHDLY